MTPTSELKRLADALADTGIKYIVTQCQDNALRAAYKKAVNEFHCAANPTAILSLIARLEKAEAALMPLKKFLDQPDAPDDARPLACPFNFGELRAARAALENMP